MAGKLKRALVAAGLGLACLTASCGDGGQFAGIEDIYSALASPSLTITNQSTPTNGASNIGIGTLPVLDFNAALDASTVTPSSVQLTVRGSGTVVPVTLTVSGDKITVRPTNGDLLPNMEYQISVLQSAGIKDINDNTLSQNYVRTFTTGYVQWHAGAYALFDIGYALSANDAAFTSGSAAYVPGAALRFMWTQFEDDQGNYNFQPLADAINAVPTGDMVAIQILPTDKDRDFPAQAISGVPFFYSIDENPNHVPQFACRGQPVPFNAHYRDAFFAMIRAMGAYLQAHPALNARVSYVNGAGDFATINWSYGSNLQEIHAASDCQDNRIPWSTFGFTGDILTEELKETIQVFMEAFPDKPQWFSVGEVHFCNDCTPAPTDEDDEEALNCTAPSFPPTDDPRCVAAAAAQWGAARYPNRFGVWREDLSGIGIVASLGPPSRAPSKIHWTVSEFRPRVGFQMVGPAIACPGNPNETGNQCRVGEEGTSPADALARAMNVGSSTDTTSPEPNGEPPVVYGHYGAPYQEIYRLDVADTSNGLSSVLQAAQSLFRSDTTPPPAPSGVNGEIPSGTLNTVALTWTVPTNGDLWDNETPAVLALTPSASRATMVTTTYNVRRSLRVNNVWQSYTLIGSSDTGVFTDTAANATAARYQITSVDAAGNESAYASSNQVTGIPQQ